MPQIGLATAIENPDTLATAAVQKYRSRPPPTCRSCEMKIEINGNTKLKPKIAVNSANHSAARLRRQLTPPGFIGGVVARGSPSASYPRSRRAGLGRLEWRRSRHLACVCGPRLRRRLKSRPELERCRS